MFLLQVVKIKRAKALAMKDQFRKVDDIVTVEISILKQTKIDILEYVPPLVLVQPEALFEEIPLRNAGLHLKKRVCKYYNIMLYFYLFYIQNNLTN